MSTEQSRSENQAKSACGVHLQRLHVAFRLPQPTPSKNAMATEKLLIVWNPQSPKECKHITPYFTEFNRQINSELNLVVTFLYEFLFLSFSFCTLSQSNCRSRTPTLHREGLTSLPHYMVPQVKHLCLCTLSYVRQREAGNKSTPGTLRVWVILLFNWEYMLLSNEITPVLLMHELEL